MSEEIGHYDSIAGAFLSAGTTMLAVMASLIPFARSQNTLNEQVIVLYFLATILLVTVVLLSIFGLVAKANLTRKRTLCVLPVIPLIVSLVLLLMLAVL